MTPKNIAKYSMKRFFTAALALLFIFMFAVAGSPPAFAQTIRYDPVTIEGAHEIDGAEELTSLNNTFVLTAKDNAPMPEGAENGVLEIITPVNSPFSFGEIRFDKPGNYEYTVSRKVSPSKNLKFDNSVYHVHVAVFTDGAEITVLEKEGAKGKPEKIKYADKYVPKKSGNIKTGDNSTLFITAGSFVLAVFLLLMIGRGRNKNV